MDVDIDTGSRAKGAVDVDVTRTTDSDTDASGSGVQTTGTTETAGQYDSDRTPCRARPASCRRVALMGLLFLGAAFALRVLLRSGMPKGFFRCTD